MEPWEQLLFGVGKVLGLKGNIYYYPNSSADNSLTGYSPPGNASRPSYLNALYSSNAQDGANGDTVGGTIYACQVVPNLPFAGLGPNLGTITTSQDHFWNWRNCTYLLSGEQYCPRQ